MAAALLATAASAADVTRCAVMLDGIRLENAAIQTEKGPLLSVSAFCRASGAELRPDDGAVLEKDGKTLRLSSGSGVRIPGRAVQGGFRNRQPAFVPLQDAAETFGYHTLFDEAERTWYLTSAQDAVPKGIRVPVLMYHAVGDEPWSGNTGLFVRPKELKAQLSWLAEHGYEPITFEDLNHLEDYEKPVMLTFDDGYDDNYTEVLPLLREYGFKATFFVVPRHFDSEHCMDEAMLREAAESGLVSIQSHTLTHPDLRELSAAEVTREYAEANLRIARITGRMPVALAYPSGRNDRQAREIAASFYDYAVIMGGDAPVTGRTDPMRWARIYVYRGMRLSDFASAVRYQ